MNISAGALAALMSSMTWAFASTRFAAISRTVGSVRVNLARAAMVLPLYWAMVLMTGGGAGIRAVSPRALTWLFLSTLCSYAAADNLFFSAARRLGTSTALAIASIYPLWAALVGTAFRGEHFGAARAIGTLLCVGGIVVLVGRGGPVSHSPAWHDLRGILAAIASSFLWAGNTISVKAGAEGLSATQVNAIRYGFALVVLFATMRLTTRRDSAAPSIPWRALVPPVLVDGLAGSMFFVFAFAHADLAIAAPLSSLAPLISVPFTVRSGEERLGANRIAAIAVTVAGAAVLGAAG